MDKISPCLWFDKNALEAAKFYVSVFKTDSRIVRVSYYPSGSHMPEGEVAVVEFTLRGRTYLGLNGGPTFKFSEAVSMSVDCKDQKEVDYFWKALTAGGGTPVQCGWLKDRYGLSWQIVPEIVYKTCGGKDRAKAGRVMRAVWAYVKPDVKALEKAAEGEK